MLTLTCDYSRPPGEIVPSLRPRWHRRFAHHCLRGESEQRANELATADLHNALAREAVERQPMFSGRAENSDVPAGLIGRREW